MFRGVYETNVVLLQVDRCVEQTAQCPFSFCEDGWKIALLISLVPKALFTIVFWMSKVSVSQVSQEVKPPLSKKKWSPDQLEGKGSIIIPAFEIVVSW